MDREFYLKIAEAFIEYDDLPNGWFEYCGMTRRVLVNYNEDWVIKLNFSGLKRNYSGQEYQNYLSAKEVNLDHYFAEVKYLGELPTGEEVYLQRRCEIDPDAVGNSFWKYLTGQCGYSEEEADNEYSELHDDDSIVAVFGENYKLIDFINDNEINDLHEENFGYDENYNPLIIDFAGF